TTGDRSGSRRGRVLADPFVFPCVVILLIVAAWPVDGDELAGYLLAVRGRSAWHLVRADVDLPLGTGAVDPAGGPWVLERKARGGQVVGVADVNDRVILRLFVWLRLV